MVVAGVPGALFQLIRRGRAKRQIAAAERAAGMIEDGDDHPRRKVEHPPGDQLVAGRCVARFQLGQVPAAGRGVCVKMRRAAAECARPDGWPPLRGPPAALRADRPARHSNTRWALHSPSSWAMAHCNRSRRGSGRSRIELPIGRARPTGQPRRASATRLPLVPSHVEPASPGQRRRIDRRCRLRQLREHVGGDRVQRGGKLVLSRVREAWQSQCKCTYVHYSNERLHDWQAPPSPACGDRIRL